MLYAVQRVPLKKAAEQLLRMEGCDGIEVVLKISLKTRGKEWVSLV